MFAKITNDAVEKYPYSIGELRKDYPNVSFPRNPTDEQLAEWGVVRVARVEAPNLGHTKEVTEGTPAKIKGVWSQTWNATDLDADTLAERTEGRAQQVRDERNYKISASDWTQLPDAPVNQQAWATYRQALRDVPEQSGFPWNVVWPIKPE